MTLSPDPDQSPEQLFYRLRHIQGRDEPYSIYRRLRAVGPAVRLANGQFLATDYATCRSVLEERGYLADPMATSGFSEAQARHESLATRTRLMSAKDGSDHQRLRSVLTPAFSPQRLAALRPRLQEITEATLDEFNAQLIRDGIADLVTLVAHTLPMRAIGALLGISLSEQAQLNRHAQDYLGLLNFRPTRRDLARADAGATEVVRRLGEFIEARRGNPIRDDLISAWANAPHDLTDAELAANIGLIFIAGYTPMTALIGNAMVALIDSFPDEGRLLRDDPAVAERCADELLRFDPPTHFVTRAASADGELGGLPITAGSTIFVLIGSASRDPRRYPNPDALDLTRTGVRELSLGAGAHRCLGAAMIRLLASIFFPAVLNRFPRMRLVAPPTRQPWAQLNHFTKILVSHPPNESSRTFL